MNLTQVELGKRNREAVREWFRTHPGGLQSECAADLKISVMAVNRHVKAIRREWKKDDFRQSGA